MLITNFGANICTSDLTFGKEVYIVPNKENVDTLVVIDFGSQFNQSIIRQVRDLGVYSELKNYSVSAEELKKSSVKGIIFSGSPKNVFEEDAFKIDQKIYELGIPILGLGYGFDRIITDFGGKVIEQEEKMSNEDSVRIEVHNPLFNNLNDQLKVWAHTSTTVSELPKVFNQIGQKQNADITAAAHESKDIYGLSFHPEAPYTESGNQLFNNFLLDICGFEGNWTTEKFIDVQIEEIQQQVGDKKVLLGLSGGVDSSVTGVLLHEAIGDQLVCIFVDHGLLRKNEVEDVMENLSGKFGLNIIQVDAKDRFLSQLNGVEEPEQKRKIIGNEFIEVFNDEAKKLTDVDFLAQGTVYPDIIESGTNTAETIKSHHNVGGLPEDMHFELVEPLKKLFKDEVRAVGEELGMPEQIVWRQPFPGPGLGIRVIGEITEEKLNIVRESDAVLREEIKNHDLDKSIWQYFTVLPGFKSVGVSNDKRTYEYTIAIRAVYSSDGVTSDWAKIPLDVLDKISSRIVNEVNYINRVVYDITSKPPSTIEWE